MESKPSLESLDLSDSDNDESPLEAFPGTINGVDPSRPRSLSDPFSTAASLVPGAVFNGAKSDEVVVKSGYLTKEGKNVKNWKKRWFVLTNDGFAYYPDAKNKVAIKKFPLSDILVVKRNVDRPEVNLIELDTTSRPFFICAASEEDMEEWMFALKYAVENLRAASSSTLRKEDRRSRAFTTRAEDTTLILQPSVSPGPQIDRRNAVLPAIDPNEVVKTGFMVKQGDSVKTWKKRWFILRKGSISYQKEKEDTKPIRILMLADCIHVGPSDKIKKNGIEFVTTERIFFMCCNSKEEMDEWIAAITECVSVFKRSLSMSSKTESITTELGESSTSGEEEGLLADLDRIPSKDILKCGHMTKQGVTVKSWKKRWFVCTGSTLAYYTNEKSKQPLRVLDLKKCTAALEASFEKGPYGIEVILPERTFFAYCDSKEERSEWIKVIRDVIARSF